MNSSSDDTMRLRLKRVEHADFRCNDATQFAQYAANMNLHGNECVMLVSRNGKVMRFLFHIQNMAGEGNARIILQSRTYRICGHGTWSGLMIRNYAEAVGIEFEGLKLFEQHFKEMQERKRARGGAKVIPISRARKAG